MYFFLTKIKNHNIGNPEKFSQFIAEQYLLTRYSLHIILGALNINVSIFNILIMVPVDCSLWAGVYANLLIFVTGNICFIWIIVIEIMEVKNIWNIT